MPDPYDPYGQYGPLAPPAPSGNFSMIQGRGTVLSDVPTETGTIALPQANAPDPAKLIQFLQGEGSGTGNLIQNARVPVMGQYIPKQYQQGAPFPMADPNTKAGQRANLGAAIGQAIGGGITAAMQRHEDQKAVKIAMDMQRLSDAITNPTPENKAMAEEILNDPKKRNDIAKTMNIQFMGDDKRKPFEKKAYQIFHKRQAEQQQQQMQQQRQQIQQQQQQGGTPYFNQLERRMPMMPQLSPEAQIQGMATKLGIIPSANARLQALVTGASDQNKLNIAIMKDSLDSVKMQLEYVARMAGAQSRIDTAEIQRQIHAASDAAGLSRAMLSLKGQLARAGATMGAAGMRLEGVREEVAGREKVAGIQTASKEKIAANKLELDKQKTSLNMQMKGTQAQLTANSKRLAGAQAEYAKIQNASPGTWGKSYKTDLENAKAKVDNITAEQYELTNTLQYQQNYAKYLDTQQPPPTKGPLYGPDYRTQPEPGKYAVTPQGTIQQPMTPQQLAAPIADTTGEDEEDDGENEENQEIYNKASQNF